MAISVRPLDYALESQQLVATLQSNLPYLEHDRLFPWLYLENPDGRALTWVAMDSVGPRLLGVAAAFPRLIYCEGKEALGYVLGDFCVDPRHRSLGLAVTLQRACLEGVAKASADFVLDFPSQNMLAVYKRLRISQSAGIIRYAKPLRADRKVAERVFLPTAARALSAVANAGLRWRDRSMSTDGSWSVVEEGGPWGDEFTGAARTWSSRFGVCVARTAAYLNWRYRQHPCKEYRMLVARRNGTLGGYLIYHVHDEDCMIDDLLGSNDSACRSLLAAATAVARNRRIHTLSVPWLGPQNDVQLLESCGFQPRESSPVITVALRAGNGQPREWHLMHGDWES